MKRESAKLLLHITVLPESDEEARSFVDDIYFCIKNALRGYQEMPNVESFCQFCDAKGGKRLTNDIRNQIYQMKKQGVFLWLEKRKTPGRHLRGIDGPSKKDIRVLLYPGDRENISDLNIRETTHNMIIEFVRSGERFFASEPHNNPPSFYQKCSSVNTALCYLEGLIIDSCLCHYLGISDVAVKHDQKQRISRDKIDFLVDLSRSDDYQRLSIEAQGLISNVISKMTAVTPYISLFSIFSVAVQDLSDEARVENYYDDFLVLFKLFQKWYFEKNGRLFSKDGFAQDALKSVFNRNTFQGQISPVSFDGKINEQCEKLRKGLISQTDNPPFGVEERWAVIVVKHTPVGSDETKTFRSLFSGAIHPATVNIIPWSDLELYRPIEHRIQVLPIHIIQ